MVFYKENEWYMCNEKARYIQDGIELENYIGVEGKQWWVDFETKWDDVEIIEFIEIVSTEIQIKRLESVNTQDIADGYSSIISDYVINGIFPNGTNHVLRQLQLEEINQQQGTDISQQEIDGILLGVQVSDMEVELLKLKGGI